MAYTPIPDAHSPAPNPNQGNAQFNINAQGFVDSLQPVIDGMNLAGSHIDQMRDEVSDFSEAAESASAASLSSANMAAAAANNKGNWSILPATAAEPPYSVNYAGSVYILQQPLANVRSVTPGTDPDTWFNYSQSSTGLTVVSGPSDNTPDRIINTDWVNDKGIGVGVIAPSYDLPSDIADKGFKSCSASVAGIGSGTLLLCGSGGVATGSNSLIFFSDGKGYLKNQIGVTDVWSEWVPFGNGGGGGGDTTSAMQGFVDLGEMGASGAVNATIDLSAGRYFFINMNTANTTGGFTFTLSNVPASGAVDAVIFVARPARKGAWTLPSNVKWANNIVPSLSATNNSVAAVHIFKYPSWTNFRAAVNSMETAP